MKIVTLRTIAFGDDGGSAVFLMLNKRTRREVRAKVGDFVRLETRDGRVGHALVTKSARQLLQYDAIPSMMLKEVMKLEDRESVMMVVLTNAKQARKAALN